MIDEETTVRMFGYTSDMLAWKSHKKIVVICDECGAHRLVEKRWEYYLCSKCVAKEGRAHLPISATQLKKEYESGINSVLLSEKYKCCHFTILKKLKNIGCKVKSKGGHNKIFLPISDIQLMEEYESGVNTYELAEKYNISQPTVWERLKNIGYDARNSAFTKGCIRSKKSKQRASATRQGISYDEWEEFARDHLYCPKFNEACRESNREKYDRRCFVCGKPESENVLSSGKHIKLSVHHVDMNKAQGCDGHGWKLVPICASCHGKAHSQTWESRITFLLENVWV